MRCDVRDFPEYLQLSRFFERIESMLHRTFAINARSLQRFITAVHHCSSPLQFTAAVHRRSSSSSPAGGIRRFRGKAHSCASKGQDGLIRTLGHTGISLRTGIFFTCPGTEAPALILDQFFFCRGLRTFC